MARAPSVFALICNNTVVVGPIVTVLVTWTHAWNEVTATGHPLGAVTVMIAEPPAAGKFDSSVGDSA